MDRPFPFIFMSALIPISLALLLLHGEYTIDRFASTYPNGRLRRTCRMLTDHLSKVATGLVVLSVGLILLSLRLGETPLQGLIRMLSG